MQIKGRLTFENWNTRPWLVGDTDIYGPLDKILRALNDRHVAQVPLEDSFHFGQHESSGDILEYVPDEKAWLRRDGLMHGKSVMSFLPRVLRTLRNDQVYVRILRDEFYIGRNPPRYGILLRQYVVV